MDLNFTPEEETFRREVREFMRTAMPPDIRETIEAGERANRDHMVRWQKILHAKGYVVQGSDQKDSGNVRRLRAKGIRVFVGHDPVNLVGARYIVVSTAIILFPLR